MTGSLSDKETRDAMFLAGIPIRYQAKSRTIQDLRCAGEIEEFIRAVVPVGKNRTELPMDYALGKEPPFFLGENGLDALYMTARGLTLYGVGTKVVTLPDLFMSRFDDQFKTLIGNALVIGIAGFTEKGGAGTPGAEDERYSVEWFIRRLLNSGKIVMFHGEQSPKESPWWGEGFSRQVIKRTEFLTI